jgi:hypothetical protein
MEPKFDENKDDAIGCEEIWHGSSIKLFLVER